MRVSSIHGHDYELRGPSRDDYDYDLQDSSIHGHDYELVEPISDAITQDEAAHERLHTPQTQTSPIEASHATGTVSPKPSESHLQKTYSAPNETALTDDESLDDITRYLHPLSGHSRPPDIPSSDEKASSAAAFGPVQVQEHGKPESFPSDAGEPMKIFIKTLTGSIIPLDVTPNFTVEQVMMLIQDKDGIPPDQQRLIFVDRERGVTQLDQLKTLKHYNVTSGSTLHVVLRLHGGGNGLDFLRTENPPPKPSYTFFGQMRAVFFNSYAHLLMLFIPAGFAVYYCHVNPIVVFTINFLAIIPSAIELAFGVFDLSLRVGEIKGELISMTFRYVSHITAREAWSLTILVMPFKLLPPSFY